MMRVLDMSQPIDLNALYTDINIFEKISGRRRIEVADLVKVCALDEFKHLGLGKIVQERVLGIEAVKKHSKLMILGKPGAGKTTFLKYIAIQCSLGEFQANLVQSLLESRTLQKLNNTQAYLSTLLRSLLLTS
jgi:predicted NACHT family NTPase